MGKRLLLFCMVCAMSSGMWAQARIDEELYYQKLYEEMEKQAYSINSERVQALYMELIASNDLLLLTDR